MERGLHLLELNDSAQEEGRLDMSSESLMKIYEINDELSETTDISRLLELKRENDDRIAVLIGEISASFRNEDIAEAKKLLARLKYYVTIEERIRSLELELGVVR